MGSGSVTSYSCFACCSSTSDQHNCSIHHVEGDNPPVLGDSLDLAIIFHDECIDNYALVCPDESMHLGGDGDYYSRPAAVTRKEAQELQDVMVADTAADHPDVLQGSRSVMSACGEGDDSRACARDNIIDGRDVEHFCCSCFLNPLVGAADELDALICGGETDAAFDDAVATTISRTCNNSLPHVQQQQDMHDIVLNHGSSSNYMNAVTVRKWEGMGVCATVPTDGLPREKEEEDEVEKERAYICEAVAANGERATLTRSMRRAAVAIEAGICGSRPSPAEVGRWGRKRKMEEERRRAGAGFEAATEGRRRPKSSSSSSSIATKIELQRGGRRRISDDPQSVTARLRRQRIGERIRVLQRLVPNAGNLDTASMLEEAARYLKFLQMQLDHHNNYYYSNQDILHNYGYYPLPIHCNRTPSFIPNAIIHPSFD